MKTSEVGLRLIKGYEGCKLEKYKCPAGLDTIGYGHVILPGERYECISQEEADDLLVKDCEVAENEVNRLNIKFKQHQFDALVSFIFNIGAKAFKISTMRQALLKGDFEWASLEFHKWRFIKGEVSKGLVRRRRTESAMFDGD